MRNRRCGMSEYKCCASIDGVCHNRYGYGVRCNGYSEDCKLRPAYKSIQTVVEGAVKSFRNSLGIKGDCE